MEEGCDVHVMPVDLETITNIDGAIIVSGSARIVWGQDWSTILRNTEGRSIGQACLVHFLHECFHVLVHFSSFALRCGGISDTDGGAMVMEDSLNLRMSKAPINCLDDRVWISNTAIGSWVEWINTLPRYSAEYKHTSCGHSIGGTLITSSIDNVICACWNVTL